MAELIRGVGRRISLDTETMFCCTRPKTKIGTLRRTSMTLVLRNLADARVGAVTRKAVAGRVGTG